MSLGLFNLVRAADRSLAAPGWFVATVSYSSPSGTKQPYGVRPLRLPAERLSGRSPTPQKPLRADRPVTLVGQLDPRRVTASRWRVRGGIETPGGRWHQHEAASAQLDVDSVVGPPRSPAPHPGGALFSSGLISSVRQPVTGPGANPCKRGRACAAARLQRSSLTRSSCQRGRRGAPVRRVAPRTGPVVTHHGPFMGLLSFVRGLGLCRSGRQPFRNRLTSNGTALRHRW
jgi:hypothetical protein